MAFDFQTDWQSFVFWPALGITRAECDEPHCEAIHWQVQLSFLFWTALLTFSV